MNNQWPHVYYLLPGLLPPQNLEFSEVTSRSFRTSWTASAARALSYLVRFRKAEDITGDYVSLAVASDTTTAVLPHLFPLTTYEVNVFAQYEKGDSFPLTGEETTLEGNVVGLSSYIDQSSLYTTSFNVDAGSTTVLSRYLFYLQNKELYVTWR